MSKPTTPNEIGTGALVFLIGTSTAGKTTLCEEIKKQDSELPTKKQLGWQVWGDDLEREWLDKEETNGNHLSRTPKDWNERTFDRAIAASRAGKSMILDTFLDHDREGGDVIWDHFKKYSASQNFTCPTKVVFLHVPVAELTKRITQRNSQALSEGGDSSNIREGIGPFNAYAELYGAYDGKGHNLKQNLTRIDVDDAVYALGRDENKKSFRSIDPESPALIESQKELRKKLGFKDGDKSINLGTRGWKPDIVYDHFTESTRVIATKIRELANLAIEETRPQSKQIINALDLATPPKPLPSPERSYAQKMVGTSKDGSREV